MSNSDEFIIVNSANDEADANLKKKEKKTKARLRTRGPYRKAHADW